MKLEEQKIGKLQLAVLIRTILPMMIMGVLIIAVSTVKTRTSLEEEVNHSLRGVASSVAAGFDIMYPGDYELVGDKFVSLYKGGVELTGNYAFIDRVKAESGMDVTLFYKDTRILTTLMDENMERYVATGVHVSIMSQMESKKAALFYKTEIDKGHYYYVCYIPLLNSDGNLIGMVGTAFTAEDVESDATAASMPIWIITVLGLLLASFISIRYTGRIVSAVKHINVFLASMVSGKLNNEMPDAVTRRNDEIAETGLDIVKMQNAVRILIECDPLTTLYNRRSGDAKMKNIMKNSKENGTHFAFAIGDIDFFKKVNDTYGHDAGDIVLKHVAGEMKELMKGRGYAVRWGGEEFLMLFEDMSLVEAGAAIEMFLDKIRAARLNYEGREIRITMTVGLVDGDTERSQEEMIKEADDKLYYGKENGRNQLVVTPGEVQPCYRMLMAEEQMGSRSSAMITFSEDFLESESLMQLMSENAAKEIELGTQEEKNGEEDE